MREMGLVEYERYHGASLTEVGLSEALRLVRFFAVDKLRAALPMSCLRPIPATMSSIWAVG